MIRAIVWKEFREQVLVGLSLLVLGSGLLATVAAELGEEAAPSTAGVGPADVIHLLGAGLLGTLLLGVTAGMVCGGSLFAAEREAGTMGFLESLPVSRWRLWRAKLSAGLVLVIIQVGAVLGVAVGLGFITTAGWAFAVIIYSLLAFCWGMYGSTLAHTTLGSVGVAIPASSLATIVFLVPIMLLFHHPKTMFVPRPEGSLLFLGLMFTTPLVGSALAFTRPDRGRKTDETSARIRSVGRPPSQGEVLPDPAPRDFVLSAPSRSRLKALLWLATHQLLRPAVALSGFAIVFGLGLLSPTLQPVLVWPVFALAAGLFAGVTMFADEQSSGNARFWGEQRLPVGRVWAVKVVVHAGFALWLTFLLTLPSILRAAMAPGAIQGESALAILFQSRLFEDQQLGMEGWKYLFVPVGYGFAVGHLCGLLFRKVVVAAGVAGLVGGIAAALWLPSLLGGGVWHWQLWLPLVVTLMTARLILRAWAADRMVARAPVTSLAFGVGLALLVMAACIGYRWIEVPDDNSGEADVVYVTTGLIPVEANVGGREFRTAAEHFAQAVGAAGMGGSERLGTTNRTRVEELTERSLDTGFLGDALEPKRTHDVFTWLTQVYDDFQPGIRQEVVWHQTAYSAARQPTGLFEHPMILNLSTGRITLENGRRMAVVILAQGLRKQAEHNPAAFLIELQTALALGRNMRNGSTVASFNVGIEVTRASFRATDRWLKDLNGRPDLLRQALSLILEDDRALPTRLLPNGQVVPAEIPMVDQGIPFDPTPHMLTERYVLRELSKAPSHWLPDQLTPLGEDKVAATSVADLVAFAWNVPWERERTRRLVGLGLEDGEGQEYKLLARGRPGGRMTRTNIRPDKLTEEDRHQHACRRALALKLAVRLYQTEKGVIPPDLGAVVAAGYLTAIPLDPYDGQPFRYEVTGPEGIAFKPPTPQDSSRLTAPLPPPVVTSATPGQARIWSVGPNHQDDGGRSLPLVPGNPTGGEDLVFLVPLPPKP